MLFVSMLFFFFFKQKTAYEMRISDWSSDVCSSDLQIAEKTGAKITLTEDPVEAVKGCDFVYTDVWVSMGEPDSVWEERIKLLMPYRVTADLMAATDNPHAKFMHCLLAFHNRDTEIGEKVFRQYGIDSMEVRSEERRGGKEGVRKSRSRGRP